MQLLDTSVEGIGAVSLRVRFHGEGGDAVEVTMADASSCDSDEAAIIRAKAILLQVARFSEDGNASTSAKIYDAPEEDRSRTYCIEYSEGEHIRRTPEVEFDDTEAVRAEVKRSAVDLLRSGDVGSDAQGWAVRALDADDNVVAVMTFDEARMVLAAETEEPPAAPV